MYSTVEKVGVFHCTVEKVGVFLVTHHSGLVAAKNAL